METEKIIPNDVYVFRAYLKNNYEEIVVPVKEKSFNRDENKVQEAYFTEEKIEKLKEQLIQKIRNSKNPFNIICVDWDGGWGYYSESELFNGNENK